MIEPGVYRGGQPTAEGFDYLRAHGITTIVKLNSESADEEIKLSTALGMDVVYRPITFWEQLTYGPRPEDMHAIEQALERGRVFIHCEHGQDRTGLAVGIYRVKWNHWTKSTAYAEMRDRGFHSMLFGLEKYWKQFEP